MSHTNSSNASDHTRTHKNIKKLV